MANKTSDKSSTKASDKSSTKASTKTSTKTPDKSSTKASTKTPDKASTKTPDKSSTKSSDNQVIFQHDEGWGVRKEGSDNTTAVYETRVEALKRAREIVENQGGEVYILHTGEETI